MAQPSHTTTTKTTTPIPLLCIASLRSTALTFAKLLSPQFTLPAILDSPNYSPQNITLLLSTLNPGPVGVIVGGGLTAEIQEEVRRVVEEFNRKGREEEGGEKGREVKVICVPVDDGEGERLGMKEQLEWCKRSSGELFGVVWE
ncbi:hypothetical protein EJ08DRAFT_676437 [Tothia fuscella]|uniref:Uncharacterized protein n=1 Tax=Tothia fuscella TaxID=1048955 RepID=A0A9P4U2M2_9PEZI|nr:hypothetical protein EJ08DRAFT_676437 [Tothia fuscella]